MSLLILPVQPAATVKHFHVVYTLEGARYGFRFYQNAFTGGWSLDVENDAGDAVVRGIALTAGLDLLYPYQYLDMPPGELFVGGTNGADPQGDDFVQGRAFLYYLEAG